MSKCVILLTYLYPFDRSEPFLENEIKYLSQFDSIYILPCSLKKGCKKTRILPSAKYRVLDMCINEPKPLDLLKWAVWSMYSFLLPTFWNEVYYIIKSKNKVWGRILSLIEFMAYAQRKYYKAIKLLKKERVNEYDEVVIYSYWLDRFAYIGVKIKKCLQNDSKVKVISRAHSYDMYEYRNKLDYIPLRRYLLGQLNSVYPISKDGLDYLKKKYPDYANKISIQRLGTSDNGLRHIEKNNPLRIVSCSSLVPVKRVDLLIEALSLITDIYVQWTHLGSGPLHQDLEKLAADKIKNNITVKFEGYMSNSKILEYYKNTPAHLFVNTSEMEGIPVSIMEAISFGMPVIATDVGGNGEIVKENKNGYLLERNFSAKKLADLIKQFSNMSEDKYLELSRNSRTIWEKEFNADKNYRRFFKTIYEAI